MNYEKSLFDYFIFCCTGVLLTERCRPQHFKPRFNWHFDTTCPWFSMSGIRADLGTGARLKKTAMEFWRSAKFLEIFLFIGTVSMVGFPLKKVD